MSEDQKVYMYVDGLVQAFTKNGVKQPAVRVGNSNNQNVYNVTIKTDKYENGKPVYVELAFWSGDWGDAPAGIQEGFWIAADGQYKAEGDQGQFHKITPSRACVVPGMVRLPREQQNAVAPVAAGGFGPPQVQAAPAQTGLVQVQAVQPVQQFTPEQIAAMQAQVNQSQAMPVAIPGAVATQPVPASPFGGQQGF